MKSIGIIPAGGSAYRFRGLAKELLPVSPDECALTRCVRAMQNGGADEVHVASRHDRITEHWRVIEQMGGGHITARPFGNWWEFVRYIGRNIDADRYYFAMPDTVFPLDTFARTFTADVSAGVFHTDKPGRFGILAGDVIVDKHPDLTGYAWGVWSWSRLAMRHAGRRYTDIFLLWAAIAIGAAVAIAAGYVGFGSLGEVWPPRLQAFGAGALLAMTAETMIPEAFHNSPRFSGLLAAFGFGLLLLVDATTR